VQDLHIDTPRRPIGYLLFNSSELVRPVPNNCVIQTEFTDDFAAFSKKEDDVSVGKTVRTCNCV
jgi:hypothetical protein